MKNKICLVICVMSLVFAMFGCGKGEETTMTGMVVSVDGTVVSLMEMDSEMPDREEINPEDFEGEGFGPGNFPGGFDSENMPEDFDPENFNGENMPEGFDPGDFDMGNLPEGFDPENMPEDFNSEDFNPEDFEGTMPGFGGMMEDVETTDVDLADAHISVEIDGGKASGSMEDIKQGSMLTITLDRKGRVTNVLVSSMGFKM